LIILLLTSATGWTRAQQLAVGVDVPMTVMQIYNGGVELTVGDRSTLGVSLFGAHHPWIAKGSKAFGVQPEYRYYFGGRQMYHHFVGLALLAVGYDFAWKGRRYDGDALGGGLTFGYVLPLGSRLSASAHAGIALTRYHHKETDEGEADGASRRQWVIMPAKIGLTLSYILR